MLLVNNIDKITDFEYDGTTEIRVELKLVEYGNSFINKCIRKAKAIDKESYNNRCFGANMFVVNGKMEFGNLYYVDNNGNDNILEISNIEKYNICNITVLEYNRFLNDKQSFIKNNAFIYDIV